MKCVSTCLQDWEPLQWKKRDPGVARMLKRFLLSYFLLCMIPFLLLGILVASISGDAIGQGLLSAAEVALDESYRSISSLTEDARQRALAVANDEAVQGQLRALAAAESREERLACILDLNGVLERYPLYGANYLRTRLVLTSDSAEEQALDLPLVTLVPPDYQETWYREAVEEPDRFHWNLSVDEENSSLRQTKMIYDTSTWSDVLGMVVVDVNAEELRGITTGRGSSTNRLYLVDSGGTIVYPYYNYDKIPEEILTARTDGTYEAGDKQMLVRRMPGTGWNLIKIVSMSDLASRTEQIKLTIVTVAVLFMCLSIAAAVYFTARISSPLTRLAAKMRKARAGELTPIEEIRGKGEVAELYQSFNYMIDHLNLQIERTYVSQIHEKDAELRALQAQINPHFLYNTLDSINWLALRYRAQDISDMVVALSDMLRLSLNKGRNTILVQDELRQVDSYITLQKVRYSDRFTVRYEVDEGARDKRIIKMLLQPIVENAIVHGFEEIEGGGEIVISIRRGDGLLHFEVRNNGTLIDLDKMARRLAGDEEGDGALRGYGIRNVNERIQGSYGPQYGIRYLIRDGMTVAQFSIPEAVGEHA